MERQMEFIDICIKEVIKYRQSVCIGFDDDGEFIISVKNEKGFKFIIIDVDGEIMFSDSPITKHSGSREFSELGHEIESAIQFVKKLFV